MKSDEIITASILQITNYKQQWYIAASSYTVHFALSVTAFRATRHASE
jgi:hypothetical protein